MVGPERPGNETSERVCIMCVCYVRVHSHAARNVTLCIYPDLKDPNLVSLQTLCHIRLLC